MREKIARAIDPLAWSLTAFDLTPNSLANYQEANRPISLSKADAVLEAMREPTEEMLNAAFDVPARAVAGAYAPDGDIEIEDDGPRLIWQAMLDAARTKESV